MATSVNRQVNIYIASGEAEKAYDRLIAKEKSLTAELKKATNPADVKRLTAELKKLEEPIDRAGKKLKGEVAPSIRELQTTLTRLQNQLKTTGVGDKEFTKLTLAVRQAKIEMAEAQQRMQSINDTASKGNVLTRLGSGINGGIKDALGIGLGPLAAVTAAAGGLKLAIDEAFEGQENLSRFQTTLENLGKANLFEPLSKQAEKLANDLKFFGADDTYVIFTSLLEYGKLTEQEIEKLTPLIIDFAVKQKISFEQASDEIIKGLQGSSKEIKKYGIDLGDASTTTERFSLLMDQLGPKVAGSASAFGETTQGRIASTREKLNDLAGTVGDKLLPVINGLLQGVNFFLTGLEDVVGRIGAAFNFVFNNAEFRAQQLVDGIKEQQAEMERYTNNIFTTYQRKNSDQLRQQYEKDLKQIKALESVMNNARSSGNVEEADYAEEQVKKLQILTKLTEEELAARQKVIDRDNEDNAAKTKAALEKDKAARLKAQEELNKLIQELQKKNTELGIYNSNQLERDLTRMEEYYNGLRERAKGNQVLLNQIADLRFREEQLIIGKYRKQWEEEEKKAAQKSADEKLKIERDRFAKLLSEQQRIAKLIADAGAKAGADQRAVTELRVLVSSGRAKLAAIKQQLKEQEQIELKAAEGKEEQIDLIYEKYRQKRLEAEVSFFQNQVESIASMVQNVVNQIDGVFQQLSQRENANLERDRQVNEQKKANLKRQLDGKVISQTEYDKKVQNIEKQQEAREKQIRLRQFQRDKVIALTNAVINNALAFTKALAQGGPIYAAVVGALGLVQIGLIASQKAPKFARGGYLSGPSHREGGMPVINPRTGRKEAEVEGGEVILSRRTVRNNTALVEQLLHASMHRNGAAISPSWRNSSHSNLNIPVISSGMARVRMFEKGGVIAGATNAPATDQQVLEELAGAVNQLNSQLASGITAYTMISDNERQQARLDNIRNDATMR